MAKNLLIVESPAKARTIKKYLGPDFEVKASVGHVVDLPKSRLGVDIEGDFEPEYQVIKGKEKVVGELKKAAKKATGIYLAPDPDREGEAIAWHIAGQLGGKPESYHRVLFHELTKKAIKKAVENPESLNQSRFDSQQARRVLDRLVGYQISPLLWEKVKGGLSAGRVQSVTLRMVVERERSIQAFDPVEYWSVTTICQADEPPPFPGRLSKLDGKKFDPINQAQAQAGVDAITGNAAIVSKLTKRKRSQKPSPPFITSTLQQEAYRKLGFSPKRTMGLAQRLYEGQDTGEGAVGLITYMRTDSTRLAGEAVDEVRGFIASSQKFGADYLPKKPVFYKSRSGAQEAHEAIRPTSILRTPDSLAGHLKKDELALYRLIWRRFLACQMAPARFDRTQAEITCGQALLRASGQVMTFDGFLKIYQVSKDGDGKDDDNNEVKEGVLPPLQEGQEVAIKSIDPKQHFTQPPPRFTEATLVRELEEKGIGRPSTYATILSTLGDRGYVNKDKRKRLKPSELGYVVSDLLVESFPQIMEVGFTAGLEEALDKVEEGSRDWRVLLKEFNEPFQKALLAAKDTMRQIKGKGIETDVKCPQCQKPMTIRLGRHGEFLACSGYPDCKSTMDYVRDEKGVITPEKPPEDPGIDCAQCGQPMVVKKGPYGPFLACSAYPECRHVMEIDDDGNPVAKKEPELLGEKCPKCGGELVIKPTRAGGKFISCQNYPKCRFSRGMPVGVDCPKCGNPLVEKRSRRGKPFFGCDDYPKCDYAVWNPPVAEPCPDCGHPLLTKKKTKAGLFLVCPQKSCKYQQALD